eukprot:NODE_26_length_2614_cov_518.330519_g25_i0.p1 GENE.NODE_26_length_2614_cov_518.330519_g25_i0~~NODE_26_length_2614_cov_518.330519_g25_i0.p1  ORF type:complete len:618 (-),score=193.59 NODE_26_length_2614_cov_518.330519_g25_i0:226-2079(-)
MASAWEAMALPIVDVPLNDGTSSSSPPPPHSIASNITIETDSFQPTATEQKQQKLMEGKSNPYVVDSRKYTLLKLKRPQSAPSYRKGGTVQYQEQTQSSAQKRRPASANRFRGALTQPPPKMFVEPYPTDPYADDTPQPPAPSPKLVMDFAKQRGHDLNAYIAGNSLTADLEYSPESCVDSSHKRTPAVSFEGQSGRENMTALIEQNIVHMSDAVYEPNDSLTTKHESAFVKMDKTITRDQREKGMARWNSNGIDPTVPWYDPKEPSKHVPTTNMAVGSKRSTVFAVAAARAAGEVQARHIFYDVKWKCVESPQHGSVDFKKCLNRTTPSSSMTRNATTKPVRDLDYALKVKYHGTDAHHPTFQMKKQLTREEAVMARRDVTKKDWIGEALPLRVKYAVVDVHKDPVPCFDKQINRDQSHSTINERKRRMCQRKSSESVDIHKSFAATKAKIKGNVSMGKSAPRFGKPGSRLMVGLQPENVTKACYPITKEDQEEEEAPAPGGRRRRLTKQEEGLQGGPAEGRRMTVTKLAQNEAAATSSQLSTTESGTNELDRNQSEFMDDPTSEQEASASTILMKGDSVILEQKQPAETAILRNMKSQKSAAGQFSGWLAEHVGP